ncbi:MAG TPA: hypothetical protein QGF58_27605 [Myxococcota bacterium]|nr:hypothetical protein [Myxococcota bacterium]
MTLLLPILACNGSSSEPEPVTLADDDNYFFDGGLDITTIEVQSYADVQLDWSGLDTDLQLHETDPVEDIDMLTLLAFRYLDEEQVMDSLSNNSLLQSDVAGFFLNEPGDATVTGIADFTLLGNDIDVENQFRLETDKIASWLVVVQSGTTPGVGSRMLKFLSPVSESDVTEIAIENTDTVLDFSVAIDGSMSFPSGTNEVRVDWSGLTVDGLQNDFDHGGIDRIMISHYAELSAADLEQQFLDLELVADDLYDAELNGVTSLMLSELEGFEGIDGAGTWVLALRCSTCTHPAPPYLTVLEAN